MQLLPWGTRGPGQRPPASGDTALSLARGAAVQPRRGPSQCRARGCVTAWAESTQANRPGRTPVPGQLFLQLLHLLLEPDVSMLLPSVALSNDLQPRHGRGSRL